MSAQITCPTCHTQLLAPPELAGQVVACPTCRQTIQLAAQPQQVAAAAAITGSQVRSQQRTLPRARPLPAQPSASPVVPSGQSASRTGSRRRNLIIVGAVLSWGFILVCIIVPAAILWRLRVSHFQQAEAARVAKLAREPAQATAAASSPARSQKTVAPPSKPAAQVPTTDPQFANATPPSSVSPAIVQPHSVPSTESPPSKPAPPPTPDKIFSTLAAHWQLPTLLSTAIEPLGSNASEPNEPLEVSVRYAATKVPAEGAVFAERTNEPGQWTICYVANLQETDGKMNLASLRLTESEWSWQWLGDQANIPLRRELANCQLELRHGDEQRIVQLRSPTALPALKIDLKQDSQKLEFQVAELPKQELIRLVVDGLDGFAEGAEIDKQSLAVGDTAKVTFSGQPGAEIELRLRSLASGTLVLQVEPRFREPNGRTYEMTLPRLAAMEEGATKALASAQKDLPIKQREVKAAVSAWKALAGSPPKNPLLGPAWQGEVNSLESKAKRAASRVESLQKQIPMHQARLEAVPKTRSFLTSIDERASIRLRLVAQCPDQEIVLVTATSAAVAR